MVRIARDRRDDVADGIDADAIDLARAADGLADVEHGDDFGAPGFGYGRRANVVSPLHVSDRMAAGLATSRVADNALRSMRSIAQWVSSSCKPSASKSPAGLICTWVTWFAATRGRGGDTGSVAGSGGRSTAPRSGSDVVDAARCVR
jgi:hypothetical protein